MPDLRCDITDGVCLLTLDRPDRRNAFSGAMGAALGAAYRDCDARDDVRVVVLTGAGRDFCVGADFHDGAGLFRDAAGTSFSAAAVEPPAFLVRKPVIAAVNGNAVGVGLTLPMQCDIRIFAREGQYGFLHVRRGVLPDAYAHWTVPRAIGWARTVELFLTGRRFDGDEAERLGLATRAVPAAEVLAVALGIAEDIVRHTAPLSVACSKRLLWDERPLGWHDVGRLETALHELVMPHPDAIEGVRAFLEKRAPAWTGRPSRDLPDPWPT